MNENEKGTVMQNPEMDFILSSATNPIVTSGLGGGDRTHKNNDEKSSFGLGGFFTSKDWYTSGHQD